MVFYDLTDEVELDDIFLWLLKIPLTSVVEAILS